MVSRIPTGMGPIAVCPLLATALSKADHSACALASHSFGAAPDIFGSLAGRRQSDSRLPITNELPQDAGCS